MKRIFLLLLFILAFAPLISIAQEALAENAAWRDSSAFYIRQLKSGVLLVRLHTHSTAIANLKASGKNDQAKKIETEQRKENESIMSAFKMEFNFCPVYFFYGDSTDAVIKKKHSGLFLNDSLQMDHSIICPPGFFMIAEEGTPVISPKYDNTNKGKMSDQSGNVSSALVMLRSDLKPMKPPFPTYAQESFPGSLGPPNWKKRVSALNGKLISFYQKSY